MDFLKKKEILIVSSYYPPHMGGIEIVAKNQAEGLAGLGHSVTVITSSVSRNEESDKIEGVQVVRVGALNFFEKFGIPFPIFSPRLMWVLIKYVKSADLVHVHDVFYISSWCAALCAWWYKKPLVLTQHVEMITHPSVFVMFVQRAVYATIGAFIFRESGQIITLNDRVEQFILQYTHDKAKFVAVPNGVDTTLFYPVSDTEKIQIRKKYNLTVDKKIILFVGRFVPKKGFDKVFAARSTQYQIVFAGGDAPGKNTEEVMFVGKRSQKEIAQLYQAADMFVLPSEGEGFPLSIQEAMATGLPIVTSYDEGYQRYNLDTQLVHFLTKPTAQTIRVALTELSQNDHLLKEMGAYSRQYAETHFSWSTVLSRLLHIYDEVLV